MNFADALALHLDHKTYLNARPGTVVTERSCLSHLRRFLESAGVVNVLTVTPSMLERFRIHLFNARYRARPLSVITQANAISAVRLFYQTLVEKGHLLLNPAKDLTRPKIVRRLPARLPTVREIERLLKHVRIDKPKGFRNRTMLELLYGTGIRLQELACLEPGDFDAKHKTLSVTGKGLKDRTLPLPARTAAILVEYIAQVRPLLPESRYLFPTRRGRPFTELTTLITDTSRRARLRRHITTHSFRHVLATELLRNGADLRSIQEYLGHKNIDTTVIYTHVLGKDLKRVHRQTHPNERRRRS